jgi:hypothetical protein
VSGPAITVPVRGDLPGRRVISDTHFGQPRLDVVFNRPSNWERLALKAWKEAVGPEDTILHLGDVARPRSQGPSADASGTSRESNARTWQLGCGAAADRVQGPGLDG